MGKKRYSCPTCFNGFSRFWNMQRHCQEFHNFIIPKPNSSVTMPGFPQVNMATNYQQPKPAESGITSISRPIFEVIEMLNEYEKAMPRVRQTGSQDDAIRNLQEQLNLHKKQIEDIRSNNWILPIMEIEGVTAYSCRRCLSISFRPTKDIGFDRTAQAKHQCDENKVRQIFMVACREIDHWNTDNFVAGELLKSIDYLFKGKKFLLASDISSWFEPFKTMRDSKMVYEFLGIPERYPFYLLDKDHNLDWAYRALNNLNSKILMTDDEIMDFLRRLKSTYGVIETYNGPNLSRTLMRIVP